MEAHSIWVYIFLELPVKQIQFLEEKEEYECDI